MALPDRLDALATEFVIELEHMGIMQVSGPDQDSFLQGQLTIDVLKLADDRARRAAHCDFKGKAWALPLVVRHRDKVLLSVNRSALDMSLAQLNKYGVFAKADILDASETYRQFALTGERAERWLESQFGRLPEAPLDSVQHANGVVVRYDLPEQLFLVLADTTLATALTEALADLPHYPVAVFEALAISQGVPDIAGSHINEWVPQMVNAQALDSIDFKKGCYMGQEVVARTRFLGKNKRAAFIFSVDTALPVDDSHTLEKQLGENWRRGGSVIRCATLGEQTWLLAVANNDTQPDEVFRLKDWPDYQFSPKPLPYTIEQSSNNVRGRG